MTPQCKMCRAYLWTSDRRPHVCPPKWLVRRDDQWDDDDSYRLVYAVDAEAAAERFCEDNDPDYEYAILRGGSSKLLVKRDGTDEILKFDVEAESRPYYMIRGPK